MNELKRIGVRFQLGDIVTWKFEEKGGWNLESFGIGLRTGNLM